MIRSFLCRCHGFFVSLHLDSVPFAGFLDLPLPVGFRLFSGNALCLGFASDNLKIPFGFFGFSATGQGNAEHGGCKGCDDDFSHFLSPWLSGCERVFPFAPTTGKPERR